MKRSYNIKILLLSVLLLLSIGTSYSQVELVSPSHPVYDYLKRMQLEGLIHAYNSANIPISRGEVAGYLKIIGENSGKLTGIDKQFLSDYKVEFEYDMTGLTKNQSSLFSKTGISNLFNDKKQKYLYNYVDSNVTFFLDGIGSLSQRGSDGDSIGINSILLGEIGFRMRGTLFNSVGYYLRLSNGQKLNGDSKDVKFAAYTDPKLKANTKFTHEEKNFDTFEGYLRYQTERNWLALTVGREAIYNGFGYIDRLFLSNNTVPFDFIKLDLAYKAIKYTFIYGSIKGDSLGRDLDWKNIVTHRLDINFSKHFKLGLSEAIITSNSPFDFTFLNPISFLTSADLNTGALQTTENNTLTGIDFEITPAKNLAFQGSLLIDDLTFETVFKDDSTANENKFAYQLGALWTNAFTVPNITLALEYTRLDPFVYSHRSNKNTYTNWGMSLGHALPPNSDEIAAKLKVDITSRLRFDFLYQKQRSANGFLYDSLGNVIKNYGGNINRGDHDQPRYGKNEFLEGNRVDRHIFTLNLVYEPIRQYFLFLKYQYRISDLLYLSKKIKDSYYWITLRIDY
ncbi:MAG: hypothetical protein H8D45_04900 [Bacteroidetes bacterium]|nr:hypothetical protein [Bacteroidota bacterium]